MNLAPQGEGKELGPMAGYVIDLNVAGRLAVVVGLGAVGRRRATALIEAGAFVIGIDPRGGDLPREVTVIAEVYRPEHLDVHRPLLVIAAAGEVVDRRVVADAKARNLLVNSASLPQAGDFRIPAIWRSGGLTIGVSTGGASPALARGLRDQVAEAIGPAPGQLANLLDELRPLVLERIGNPESRRSLLESWGDPVWLQRLAIEGPDQVRRALIEAIEERA